MRTPKWTALLLAVAVTSIACGCSRGDAQAMGLSAIRVERGGGPMRIALRRPQAAGPGQPARATVTALVLADDRSVARLVSRDVVVGAGAGVVLQWNGESLL
jgi:hypothetical protein